MIPTEQTAAHTPPRAHARISAVQLYRSVPRYVAARTLSASLPRPLRPFASALSSTATAAAPLRLHEGAPPALPSGDGWARVRPRLSGICGSDLATVTGRSSFYFASLISLPFTPGHEVVGELIDACPGADSDGGELPAGTRVVIAPVLGCDARGLPRCEACASGRRSRCERITSGHLAPGLQTGYCADTGGGWSGQLVAHRSQLFAVPDDLPDERAVLIEPLACAIHAVRRAAVEPGERVLVVGAGAIGLLTLLALRAYTSAGEILVAAKHPKQRTLAAAYGANQVIAPTDLVGGVRRATRALRLDPEHGSPYLLGGVDVTLECSGSGLDAALRVTRAGGRVILSGLPTSSPDLTALWFRELSLTGAYAADPADMTAALELAAATPALDDLVGGRYPLERWRDALDHALSAGRLGTGRVVFELPTSTGRIHS
ncbi:MAG TPA: alcohol dehydrogenase catalytic domain-containing protein [Frankiaceae bacterium]|nr:alcohol dehydrogenase catalytic domain-containing protein [Frankiaceae bacterium]